MKYLLITLLLPFSFSSFSQTVNDIPIKDIDVQYIEIVGTGKIFSTKLTIQIDFGQHDKVFRTKDTQVKDLDGKLMIFNSMVDAMNFFGTNGYEFEQAYVVTVSNSNIYHYLMRKEQK
jgi:hypothetical protein